VINDKKIEDVLAHLNLMANLKSQKDWHFRTHSKLWKSVYNAIAYGDDLVAHPKNHLLKCYRGSGIAVSFRDVCLYAKDYTVAPTAEAHVVGLEIEIEYVHEDQDGQDWPDIISKKFTLQPPTEFLADQFTDAEFNEWVGKVKSERDAKIKEKDLETLAELRRKYPNEF